MRESWSRYSESLDKSREYHKRWLIAISNEVRRKILEMIDEGKSEEEILNILRIDKKELDYHLKILEWGFCIQKEDDKWILTKEGEIVKFLKK